MADLVVRCKKRAIDIESELGIRSIGNILIVRFFCSQTQGLFAVYHRLSNTWSMQGQIPSHGLSEQCTGLLAPELDKVLRNSIADATAKFSFPPFAFVDLVAENASARGQWVVDRPQWQSLLALI
jgi:hypothetical protein